jgi:CHAD domain-containing protein
MLSIEYMRINKATLPLNLVDWEAAERTRLVGFDQCVAEEMEATVANTSEALETPHGETAYAQAMGRLIEERFAMMMSYREGTLDGSDPEDLHQMRVWSRRLRAAMDVSASCFPKRYKFFHQRVKQLTDVLGDVRDNDVMIEELSAYRDARPTDERPAIAEMIRELRQRREVARDGMLTFFNQLERERFDVRFQGFIAEHTHG